MTAPEVFSAKVSPGLKKQIHDVCRLLGLRKSFLVEEALREKIEELWDAYDLREAVKEATGFHSWESIKKGIK